MSVLWLGLGLVVFKKIIQTYARNQLLFNVFCLPHLAMAMLVYWFMACVPHLNTISYTWSLLLFYGVKEANAPCSTCNNRYD